MKLLTTRSMCSVTIMSLLAILAFTGCGSQSKDITTLRGIPVDTIANKTDALIQQYQALDIFSGTVLIAKNKEAIYYKAFGMADREKEIPNSLTSTFNIGSINKFFTKVVILQLVQEGKLSVTDTIGKFLQGFAPEIAGQVTITQLLNHTSGYGDYMMQPGFFDIPANTLTMETILEMIKTFQLEFSPGTDKMYSNAGYIILGGIIASVTGKSYAENVHDRIVQPLHLSHMVLDEKKLTDTNMAVGYMQNMFGEIESDGRVMPPTSAGGFLATADDLLTFFYTYLYSDVLVNATVKQQDEMHTFFENAKQNGKALPIAGGLPGYNSVVFNVLKDSITVIVLANMDEPVAEHLGKGILAIINNENPAAPEKPVMQNVYAQFRQHGADYVKQHFEELTQNSFPGEPKDMILNAVGYNLLFNEKQDEAIAIFQLNTELFPSIANVWDSYGEALLMKGDSAAALSAYQKALSIRPEMPSALEAVRKINGR